MRSAAIAKPRSQVRLSDKRRLIGDGSAVLQAEHAIAISEALIAMCNHHHGRAGLEIEHGLDDFTLRRHVDRARCFIKYEQIRPPEHGAGKTQTLAFAAGNDPEVTSIGEAWRNLHSSIVADEAVCRLRAAILTS